tara:strand:- start:239 stop:1507 length:1269 start_codon:yes stop_codon:yes gene_type:complete
VFLSGETETAIGEVINSLDYNGEVKRESLVVVSKVGLLEGKSYVKYSQEYASVVHLKPQLAYCLDPDFIEKQLNETLLRLNLTYLDGYLLQNPEYFFQSESLKGLTPTQQHDVYYRYIQQAFERLELLVSQGKLSYYGICSDAFAVDQKQLHSISLQRLLDIANHINAKHFKLLQCPFNVLDTTLARSDSGQHSFFQLAQSAKMGVLINRSLNATVNNQLIRLVDVEVVDGVSQLELDDLIGAGVEYESELLQALVQEEHEQQLQQYLCFFSKIKDVYADDITLFSLKECIDLQWIPAVEQYMLLLGSAALKPELEDRFQVYFSHFNQLVKCLVEYFSQRHQFLMARLKLSLVNLDQLLSVDFSMQRMVLRAYRQTQGVGCVVMGIRSLEQLDAVTTELAGFQPQQTIDWNTFDDTVLTQLV